MTPNTQSRQFRGRPIYAICTTCIEEYCPNREHYKPQTHPGKCDICGSKAQFGVCDPIDAGGLRRE